MKDVLVLLVVIVAAFGVGTAISTYMTKRAMTQVIRIFRRSGAVDITGAKTAAELGLTPADFVKRIYQLRDYKPRVLNLLIQMELVQACGEGRLFLKEGALESSNLAKRWPGVVKKD